MIRRPGFEDTSTKKKKKKTDPLAGAPSGLSMGRVSGAPTTQGEEKKRGRSEFTRKTPHQEGEGGQL